MFIEFCEYLSNIYDKYYVVIWNKINLEIKSDTFKLATLNGFYVCKAACY